MKTIITLTLCLLSAVTSFAADAARVGGNLLVDGISFSSGGLPMTTPPQDGKSVRSGAFDPIAQIGNEGDFYINTLTNMIFGPKTGSAWGSGVTLVGPQGPAGQNGSGPWQFDSNTGNVWLTSGGMVGIGTSVPSEQLELTGNLRLQFGGKIMMWQYPLIHSTGTLNFFSGLQAGGAITTGQNNSASGYQALYSNTSGSYNSANGASALNSNIYGSYNTANGYGALGLNISGNQNIAVGTNALYSNTIGHDNSASGNSALYSNIDGNYNSALGSSALNSNTTGNYNTAVGINAGSKVSLGYANITGSNNTYIGANAGPGTSTEISNATAIGADATVSQSNSIVLGAPNVKVGIGMQAPGESLDVVGNIRASGAVTATSFSTSGSLTASGISSSNGLDIGAGTTNLAGGGVLSGTFNATAATVYNGTFNSPTFNYPTINGGNANNFLNMGSNKIINLAGPTQPTDAANKAYVDGSNPSAIIYGLVFADGTCIVGCDKFSSAKTATGSYKITFTTPFSNPSITTVSPFGVPVNSTVTSSVSTIVDVKTYLSGSSVIAQDGAFTFITVGPK